MGAMILRQEQTRRFCDFRQNKIVTWRIFAMLDPFSLNFFIHLFILFDWFLSSFRGLLLCVSSCLLPDSQPFPDPTPFRTHQLYVFSFVVSIKTGSHCPNILGYMVIHWIMVNLLGATLLEKLSPPSQKLVATNSSRTRSRILSPRSISMLDLT